METLIICDIQPEYCEDNHSLISNLIKELESDKYDSVIWFYVGDGITDDNETTIHDMVGEALDYDNERMSNILDFHLQLIDKGYGFFRGWMDTGICHYVIVDTVKQMIAKGINDSRDYEELSEELRDHSDNIYIPHLDMPTSTLKHSNNTLIGGGVNACLAELALYFDALDIKYEIDYSLVY